MQNEKSRPVAVGVDRKYNSRELVGEGALGLIYTVVAFLFGGCRMFFGTYPLGFALLASATRKLPWIAAGLIASAFASGKNPGIYAGVYFILLILRLLARVFIDTSGEPDEDEPPAVKLRSLYHRVFGENIYLRMTAGAVGAFLVSLYRLISGGYHYYDLFGALFVISATPAAVLLGGWFFEGDGEGARHYKYLAGVAAALVFVSLAARRMTLFGISVGAFGIFFAILYICARRGTLPAAAAGLLCGLAYSPVLSPVFVLAAVVNGVLQGFSRYIAAGAACIAGLLWGFYIDGIDTLTTLLPGLLLSLSLFCGLLRAGLIFPASDTASGTVPAVTDPVRDRLEAELAVCRERADADEERMLALSDGFASLSEVFYSLSDRLRRPGMIDMRRVCDGVCDRFCPGCRRHDICWGLEYGSSLDMLSRLGGALHEHGRVSPDVLPENIRHRCDRLGEICDAVNSDAAALYKSLLKNEKFGLFAADYEAISGILAEAVEEQRREYGEYDMNNEVVCGVLGSLGIDAGAVVVRGGRNKYICARGIDADRVDTTELRSALETALSCLLDEPLVESERGKLNLTLRSRPRYAAYGIGVSAPANEDERCGDSYLCFGTDKNFYHALISDGMGTGKEAACSSGVVTLFLEKMLSAGNSAETSLRLLNNLLRSQISGNDAECSATVDLLSVDLLDGRASVIKSGAAPTYVRRSGDIFKLKSKTLPIGILPAIDAQKTTVELGAGDVVILVSDGVSDVGDGDRWLTDLLAYEWENDLGRMADKIIGRARCGGARDDVSAVLVRITPA